MQPLIWFVTTLISFAALRAGESQTKRYLYLSTPDAAQEEGRSGTGILIFDIDNGHQFVRRIDIPIFKEGLRGFTGNLKTGCVYYSTTNRRLGCFDLVKEKIVWEKTYDAGCDRSSITLDAASVSERRENLTTVVNDPDEIVPLKQLGISWRMLPRFSPR